MKTTLFSGIALIACVFSAQAQFFTKGNLAVVRIGGSGQSVATSDSGNSVFIDQYTPTPGGLVSSFGIPTNGSSALVLDGEPYSGLLTATPTGTKLVIAGFNTNAGGGNGNVAQLAATNCPRAVATIDGYGNYDLAVKNMGVFNTFRIPAAVSDGSNFWAIGTGGTQPTVVGVAYLGTEAAPATNLVDGTVFGTGGGRGLVIYNNSLYELGFTESTDATTYPNAGAYQIADLASDALPTNTASASLAFNTGTSSATTPMDLAANSAGTIAYIADSGLGIIKFTNSGSGWVSNYTVNPTNTGYTGSSSATALSVTADFTQTPPVVYAVTGEKITNRLVMFQDTGAKPTIINLASNLLVTGAGGMTNTFRGVRFAPGSVPMITGQPQPVVQSAAGSATFTVTALGSPAPSYQWYANGSPVSGATTSSLSYENVTTYQNGTAFDAVVSNAYGTATSSNAVLTVNAVYFSPGNLAVVTVGGQGQYVSTNGIAVSIDQFTTSGSLVSALALPTTGSNAFVLDNSTTEGFMTVSGNAGYLVLGGYNTPVGSGFGTAFGLNGTASSAVSRSIATIDGYGNYVLQITNNLAFSTWPITSAVFDGTNNFWMLGESSDNQYSGVLYVGSAASPTTVNVATTGNEEAVLNLYNGSLFVDSSFAPNGIYQVLNTNVPAAPLPESTNAVSSVISLPGASRNKDFVFDSGMTTCYYADSSIGIVKYTNNAGTWVSNYTIAATTSGFTTKGALGITADWSQNPVVVYATTAETTGNRLIALADSGATAVPTFLAQAVTNHLDTTNVFRGLRFVPGVPPLVTVQPAPVIQDAGGSATFSVSASGTPVLTYQWYTNSVAVAGATASSFILNPVTTNLNGAMVTVVVSNDFGSATSSAAQLTVQPAGVPLAVSINPPLSVNANAGGTVTFTASAIGSDLTYTWMLNGAPLSDGGSVSGSSTATLTISPVFVTYAGTYTVTAGNSFGSTPGNNSATLAVTDPVIITQPVGSTNVPGATGSTTLSVTAAGAPPLTYQWLSNGVAVAGASTSSFGVANTGAIGSSSYSVVVANSLGYSVTSAVTTVSFTPVLLSDTFSYPNGNLFGDLGSPWIDINGTNPELVTNGRVQISESNATTDAQSRFSTGESGQVMWASFLLNVSTLPSNPGGVYFANLEDTNFGFYGRIFVLTSNQSGFTPNISPVAFPGTYRLGIANAQNDSTGSFSTGPTAVVPLDLAPGIDYEVVFFVNFQSGALFSGMAVNPASLGDAAANSPGGVSSGAAQDSFNPTLPIAAFGLRQRLDTTPKGEGEGVMEMDNLVVSFDWNGPGSGYDVVTAGVNAAKPVIGLQPAGTTNFENNPYVMEVAASGIGFAGTGLSYAWYQNGAALSDGGDISGSATATLTIAGLDATNSGTYRVVISGAGGSVQSSNAVILVNTNATAPVFSLEPASDTTNSEGGSVTFTSLANGTGPITYAWYFDGNPLGVSTPDLTLSGLLTNESGTYYVIATGDNGLFQTQSSNAVLTVTGPKSVTIGYLRSLLNPTTYLPSDETSLFTVTGVITTATNQTSGDTASYYLQDSTGGINLFVTFGSDFRPGLGDLVTATGVLSTFADNYELDVSEGSANYVDTILGANSPLPTPILFPWGNDTAPLSPFLSTNVEGSVVMITNLYFEAYTPGAVFTAGTDYTITNNTGEMYTVFVSDEDTNYVTGKPIPKFATSIAGPLVQDDTTIGISFTVYSNLVVPVVTVPPLTNIGPVAASVMSANGANSLTLDWTAAPSNYTYSVWATTNLLQPFSNLVSGLVFTNTVGTYTDPGQTSDTKYYEIRSP